MTTQKTKTRPWDLAEHIRTDEDAAGYLDAALEDGDATLVAAVLGDIIRARGMMEAVVERSIGKKGLQKLLSPDGSLDLTTTLKVVRALGLQLHASVAETKSDG